MAAAMPVLSVVGSIAGALMQMGNQPEPPPAPQPVPPPPPPAAPNPEPTMNAETQVDQEQARNRELKRRRAAQTTGLSLLAGQDNSNQTTGSL